MGIPPRESALISRETGCMRHISLHCPKCGDEQWSRVNELAHDFRCNGCGTTFHVDTCGRCLKGPRPKHSADPYQLAATGSRPPVFDPFGYWAGLARPVKLGLASGILVVSCLAVACMVGSSDRRLPESLEARTSHVALAFVRGDREGVAELADPSTVISLNRWIDQTRPPNWHLWVDTVPHVRTTVLFRNARNKTAATVATVTLPVLPASASASPSRLVPADSNDSPLNARGPRLELLLYWRLDDSALWVLDGGQTLRAAAPRRVMR